MTYPKTRIRVHKRVMAILGMIGWTDRMKAFAIQDLITNNYRRRRKGAR